jgi:uncharacterized protein YyaL (SSP411 family)
MKIPNKLSKSASPYLLQHAHNPIDWYPWSAEALSRAQQEDKPILLSIGYAACHWCHVMAQETFEDPQVAAIMNQYFVCIKVDREERPDIDQIYIQAVQAMGLQAGWPLHVFLLPNQQPFYGGTYFSNATWKELLLQIVTAFKDHRQQLEASAIQFTQALHTHAMGVGQQGENNTSASLATLQHIFQKIYQELDLIRGGVQGAPKFPMPSLGAFLLNYYRLTHDQRALDQLTVTLTHMACGGIYDQLGGGFARYAIDEAWLIPHFEKMLYDNAQLTSLYAQTYLITPDKLYKQVIEQTVNYVEREMTDRQGGFYSSMDADSEGVEGKFYTWTPQEVAHVLKKDAAWFVEYFPMVSWGHGGQETHILARNPYVALTESQAAQLQAMKQALFEERSKRIKPLIDDKILASWNGMMLQALVDAYYALGTPCFLGLACRNAAFMQQYLIRGNQLGHSYYQGKLGDNSYLEDYAWVARALISLYQATFEEAWLAQADSLVKYAIQHFWDEEMHLFCSTVADADKLIARPREILDQATPSSNAVMAHNLFYLGALLGREDYATKAQQMLHRIMPLWKENPLYLAHWASLYALQLEKVVTIAILGPQYQMWAYEIKKHYPNVLLVGTVAASNIPLLKDKKVINNQASIYICYDKTCQLPVQSLQEVYKWLQDYFSHSPI